MMGDFKDGRLGSETTGPLAVHPLLPFALALPSGEGICPGSLSAEGQVHGSYKTGGDWVQWVRASELGPITIGPTICGSL